VHKLEGAAEDGREEEKGEVSRKETTEILMMQDSLYQDEISPIAPAKGARRSTLSRQAENIVIIDEIPMKTLDLVN
jgi:hypothetical protein